jgi:predicted GH43/DUF377 family glycosyl hydrolase
MATEARTRAMLIPACLAALTMGASPTDPVVLAHLNAASGARKWADASRSGRPFSKDPAVLKLGERYLLYYSEGPSRDPQAPPGWAIGIAESSDLRGWHRIGEVLPEQDCERHGLVNGNAMVLDGQVHLFYNTYGNGAGDALCHAVSTDGLHFRRDPTNPIFRPAGAWTCGRAIDLDVVEWGGRLLLVCATRDPSMRIQMLVAAAADRHSDFGRAAWRQLGDGPLLSPQLPWERHCIEAPSFAKHDGKLYLFYGGGYNNDPQQIGCAVSTDGQHFTRLFDEPLFPNGGQDDWNASETGHPGFFADDGTDYLFFQANRDHGQTWYVSWVKIGWRDDRPYLVDEP